MPIRLAAFGVAVAAAALAGVAPAAVGARATDAAPPSVTVRMTDGLQFRPARLTVARGTRVVWRNAGSVAHTITTIKAKAARKAEAAVPKGAKAWDSGFVAGGRTYSRTLSVPGTYRYFCVPHEGARMVGTIVVE